MQAIRFGKSWFRARKQLTESWEEAAARTAHDQRLPYVAVSTDAERIRWYVEVSNDYFGVGFFDSSLREFLSYQFQELEPERLFLTMVTHRNFHGESDQVNNGTTYFFKPNGNVTLEEEDFTTGLLSTKEMQSDVAGNWESYPKFGDYRSLVRTER